MKGKYITEHVRTLTVKLLRKIADEVEYIGEDCYAWASDIGEALLPISWLSGYLTDVKVESLCDLLDHVEEENWDAIKERIGDNLKGVGNGSQKSI